MKHQYHCTTCEHPRGRWGFEESTAYSLWPGAYFLAQGQDAWSDTAQTHS